MMLILLDMGTTNTRLYLSDGNTVLDRVSQPVGAGAPAGSVFVKTQTASLIGTLLRKNGLEAADIDCILASGMATAECGLCEVPHRPLPADTAALAEGLFCTALPEITSIPFRFVAGLKKQQPDGALADILRGEETETMGVLGQLPEIANAVLLLPGTHNKIILIDGEGQIADFATTMSGEVLHTLMQNTILRGDTGYDFTLQRDALQKGAAACAEKGLGNAAFCVRVGGKNGESRDTLTSFLYGAVLGADLLLIRRMAAGRRIYIGGQHTLRTAYQLLLEKDDAVQLPDTVCENAVPNGLLTIYRRAMQEKRRAAVLDAISRHKLIAILRGIDDDRLLPTVEALYAGGVRLCEYTFDSTGKRTDEETAAAIARIYAAFGDRMLVGAGTVTTPRQVALAAAAGAAYMISPNVDPAVIRRTRRLGLVSLPGALTPTEIAVAMQSGADFVKVFPADQLQMNYAKAVKAPLPGARLLAVGGVTVDNVGDFLQAGYDGVGIASGIVDKKRIAAGDFAGLSALAAAFVAAIGK